jgi:hypothetical protein
VAPPTLNESCPALVIGVLQFGQIPVDPENAAGGALPVGGAIAVPQLGQRETGPAPRAAPHSGHVGMRSHVHYLPSHRATDAGRARRDRAAPSDAEAT